MAIDLDSWAPRKIITIPNDQPGKIVSAEYWSSLWQKVIEQGDYGQDTLKELIDKLNITAWHPTTGALSVSNPALYAGGAIEVSGQLSELKAFAAQIVADLNATAWHLTDGALSIKAPVIYPLGSTTVKGQIIELKSHVDTAESDIDTETARIDDLLDGTLVAYNAARLNGQLAAFYGTATQVSNLQSQITNLSMAAISAFNHNDISARNAADAHPQSAITGLATALSTLDSDIGALEAGTVQAGDAAKLGNQLPAYYAKQSDLTTQTNLLAGLTHASFSDKNNAASHLASAVQYAVGTSVAQKIANMDVTIAAITGDVSSIEHADLLNRTAADGHSIAAITDLQTSLNTLQTNIDGKAATSHGTHVTYGATTAALVAGGTGAVGAATEVARASHTHTLPAYPTVSLGALGVTASAAELNKLTGATPSTAEINTLSGIASSIQTQLNAKQKTITASTSAPSGGSDGDVWIVYG